MRIFLVDYRRLDSTYSLSSRVALLRELRNLTVLDLAKRSRFPIKRIESIESGEETWLSVTDRQVLARALGVEPAVLKEVENSPADYPGVFEKQEGPQKVDTDSMAEEILNGYTNIACPRCSTTLKTSVEFAYDIEGNPTKFARAYCPQCPFALR
ncbi:MAG: helix-turn-helix domain-containing protein [Candidatus Obscuribacterales bacterium]|nr:helix-turn-helix domain-containing protein [Candidatus Obscuribacterales bacterium]